jgi:two-component system LytT family response regulator
VGFIKFIWLQGSAKPQIQMKNTSSRFFICMKKQNMDYNAQNTKSIIVSTKLITKQIIVSEISHIVCDAYLCDIFMENDKITCTKLLKYFESELNGYGFIRINNSIIVNVKYIKHIENKTRTVILKNGIKLKVSSRRWKGFKSFFINL